MSDNKKRILLVEDSPVLSNLTTKQLTLRNYCVKQAFSVAETLKYVEEESFDIILMDIMLPDGDGIETVKVIREDVGFKGPIIYMSCIGDGTSIVDSFRNGGNDYLIKPVDIEVLEARIEENLSQWESQNKKNEIKFYKTFCMDKRHHEVRFVADGKSEWIIDLSPKEYSILETFIEHEDEILLYEEIFAKVWNADFLDDSKTVMVHVSNLRKKIDPDNLGYIKSIRGTGYIFKGV